MKRVPTRLIGGSNTNHVAERAPFVVDVPRLGDCTAFQAEMSSIIDHRSENGDGAVGIQLSKASGAPGVNGLLLYALMTPDQADQFASTLKNMASKIRAEAFSSATEALRKAAGK